ncbi:hypothetical protein D6D18_09838 [Aureobasidium pullulans]|nr:hypothetical protein D6D18_09838 [Aureobasidium pullulans]
MFGEGFWSECCCKKSASMAEMSRNQNVTLSSPGAMTPTSTIMNSSTNLDMDEPTTIILLAVYNHKDYLEKKVEIKLRMNTSFGKLATLLRSKGKYTAYEWRIIFESDTPASLNLEDRAQLRFEVTQDEILDASNML